MRPELTPEIKFCVKYLLEHGVNGSNFGRIQLSLNKDDPEFTLVEVKQDEFFDVLAAKLRELWPPGDKAGKYPWRESVPNISRRLRLLWAERMNGKTYTIEQCLAAARKYLAQFEQDTKYMKVLKYFILKQEQVVKENGHLAFINKSTLADMLESSADELAVQNEWDEFVSSVSTDDMELI